MVLHNKRGNKGEFYYETEGAKMAEMTYTMAGPSKMIIEHTEVDESLEGQGIGKQMLEELVQYAREEQLKVMPLCAFAKAMFDKKPEWEDVLF